VTGLDRDGDGRGRTWPLTAAGEPMTWLPNTFVTGEDLLVLEPGQQVRQTLGIPVRTHRI
jgi:hypothetical protein